MSAAACAPGGGCDLPPAARVSLAVCVVYALTSMILALVNKALLSSYGFQCYFLLLSCQLAVSYVFCLITRDCYSNPFGIPAFSWATARASAPMGIMYVINVGFGLVGLQLVNVPMFFCIRRLVSPMILIVEFVTMGRIADSGTQLAVVLIVLGTLLAGYETLSADILGYALTFANNICTAAASILQKRFSDAGAGGAGGKVTTFTIVYYNSIVALPLAMLCIVLGGEISTLLEFPYLYDVGFWARYAVAVSMGLMLTYTSMLCTTYNSPLATSVTGNVKDIATTTLGYVMFPGFLPTVSSVSGLGLAFLGAFVYSYIGLRKSRDSMEAAATARKTLGSMEKGGVGPSGSTDTPTSDGPTHVVADAIRRLPLPGQIVHGAVIAADGDDGHASSKGDEVTPLINGGAPGAPGAPDIIIETSARLQAKNEGVLF